MSRCIFPCKGLWEWSTVTSSATFLKIPGCKKICAFINLSHRILAQTFAELRDFKKQVTLKNLRIKNKGWRFLCSNDHEVEGDSTAAKIRKYKIDTLGETNFVFDKAGPCCIENVTFDSSLT